MANNSTAYDRKVIARAEAMQVAWSAALNTLLACNYPLATDQLSAVALALRALTDELTPYAP